MVSGANIHGNGGRYYAYSLNAYSDRSVCTQGIPSKHRALLKCGGICCCDLCALNLPGSSGQLRGSGPSRLSTQAQVPTCYRKLFDSIIRLNWQNHYVRMLFKAQWVPWTDDALAVETSEAMHILPAVLALRRGNQD
jgi:hypothetical protein